MTSQSTATTATYGYGAVAGLFTAKERDEESGLDYFVARYMGSGLGRFTSADEPFADQRSSDPQSWNLFSYVRNNPLAMVDLTGRDALWVTNKNTNQTTLRIPVKFSGSGATKQNIDTIVERANSLDTGGSGVKIEVIPADKPINGVINELDFSPGLDKETWGAAGEGVRGLGGNVGHINSDTPTGTDAAVHDILHFAGIEDQYDEGQPDSEGNRTSVPSPGYSNTNIMTSRLGTELNSSQLQEANENGSTKHCLVDMNGKMDCD